MNIAALNPEFVRNSTIQLRPGRAAAAATVCAAVSFTTWKAAHSQGMILAGLSGGSALFTLILYFQIVVLLIGGGLYCIQAVHREKEQNTFDYQRVTRLSPLELALGKLFGAPVLAYFVFLCLTPVALVGAISGEVPIIVIIQAYAIIILGSIAFHALALMMSVMLGRGSSVLTILGFLILVWVSAYDVSDFSRNFALRKISPFYAPDWVALQSGLVRSFINRMRFSGHEDRFFGLAISHLIVVNVIFISLTLWFLLAIVRNIKRDPAEYQLFSPLQGFGFVVYLHVLMLGFLNREIFTYSEIVIGNTRYNIPAIPPLTAEISFLTYSAVLFFLLGLTILRNREQVRLRLLAMGSRATGLMSSLWPAPYLLPVMLLAGVAIVATILHLRPPDGQWEWGLAIYEGVFVAVWLLRDILYMQWMNLRRSKRPLAMAFGYLLVFYVCVTVILISVGAFSASRGAALTATLIPSPLFLLGLANWDFQRHFWMIALILQVVQVLAFALLNHRRLREMALLATN